MNTPRGFRPFTCAPEHALVVDFRDGGPAWLVVAVVPLAEKVELRKAANRRIVASLKVGVRPLLRPIGEGEIVHDPRRNPTPINNASPPDCRPASSLPAVTGA